jgi:hypothetical protein
MESHLKSGRRHHTVDTGFITADGDRIPGRDRADAPLMIIRDSRPAGNGTLGRP